jgi:hypothetical protein
MADTPMRRALIAAAWLLLLIVGLWLYDTYINAGDDEPDAAVALLIGDDVSSSDPLVTIWTDAAREEGIRMQVVSASGLLRPTMSLKRSDFAGIILPDTVIKKAGAPLLKRLTEYVESGGKLMPVYDAATHTIAGNYFPDRAPLSEMVGVDYALYDSLQDHIGESGYIWGEHADMKALRIPPGKSQALSKLPPNMRAERPETITGYQYGALRYASFATRGNYRGRRLLSSATGGLVAGYHVHGKGGVLFVNLPLGYLKGQTDGLLLHCFLRYFADDILALPTLSAAPDARGGLVFNWHVDSNAAIGPMNDADKLGMMQQGPFSIHFTAGPDARKFGDGLGLDLEHNAVMQNWIKRLKARGDALGDHGGWIHDYFGLNVNDNNQAQMERYLTMNDRVVSALNGGPVREYSAPVGTQPKWVTAWLEKHGFVAYYFVGNGGMAPTRSYRDGKLDTKKIWSFPVLTFGKVASFEEAAENDIPEEDMSTWLQEVSDYAGDTETIRTFYSHPPGFRRYPNAIRSWFAHTADLITHQRFRWYTMTQAADFLNRRERTSWHIEQDGDRCIVEAEHPDDLDRLAWRFPKSAYQRPVLEKGSGSVQDDDKYWLVVANPGKILRISTKRLNRGGLH